MTFKICFFLIFNFSFIILNCSAQVKVSSLPGTSVVKDSDMFLMVQDSTSKRITYLALSDSLKKVIQRYVIGTNPILGIRSHFNTSYQLFSTGVGDTSITNSKIAPSSIDSGKIVNASITGSNIKGNTVLFSNLKKLLIEARTVPAVNDTITLTGFTATPKLIYSSWMVRTVSISATQAVIKPIAGYGNKYDLLFIEN